MSRLFNLPLKTPSNSKGIYTEDELYAVLTLTYMTVFLDIDPAKSFPLRQATKTVADQLGRLIESNLRSSANSKDSNAVGNHGANFVKTLSGNGMSNADIAWTQILPAVVGLVPTLGTAVCYLSLPPLESPC